MVDKCPWGGAAMVKLGFIVEGDNEKAILNSALFEGLMTRLGLDYVKEVFNAKGGGNLLPQNIGVQIDALIQLGATSIFILTDQEEAPCITEVKNRVSAGQNIMVVVAVKAIEAWFLADNTAISKFMGAKFQCEHPESYPNPFLFIKQEKIRLTGRGVDKKRLLCSRILASGFSLEAAATHPNCPSAKYFLDKLKSLTI